MEFPSLELFFDAGKPKRFLIDAAFRKDATARASDKLVTLPPRGNYFRAMCIFMALAKYHGPHDENPDEPIIFRETKERNSWLNYLGNSLGEGKQTDFFRLYFSSIRLLKFER